MSNESESKSYRHNDSSRFRAFVTIEDSIRIGVRHGVNEEEMRIRETIIFVDVGFT